MCSPWDTVFPLSDKEFPLDTASGCSHPTQFRSCAFGFSSTDKAAAASPLTCKTSVPTDSASSSDDEEPWPDPFRKVLGFGLPPGLGLSCIEAPCASVVDDSLWGTSLFEVLPSQSLGSCDDGRIDEGAHPSAKSDDRPELLHIDVAELVDLSEAEGRRRGQEIFALLLDRMPDDAQSNVDDSSEMKPLSEAGAMVQGSVASEAEQTCEVHNWWRATHTCSNVVADAPNEAVCYPADGGHSSVQETVDMAAKVVLGEWYAGTFSAPDRLVVQLYKPESWRGLSFSEAESCAAESLDLATNLLDQRLWSLLGGKKACRLQRSSGCSQLVMHLAPEGHSLEKICWDFSEHGHCARRRCSWVHAAASRSVIDVEFLKDTSDGSLSSEGSSSIAGGLVREAGCKFPANF